LGPTLGNKYGRTLPVDLIVIVTANVLIVMVIHNELHNYVTMRSIFVAVICCCCCSIVRILCAKLNDRHYVLIFSHTLTATEQNMYFDLNKETTHLLS